MAYLGSKNIVIGETKRFRINYTDYLPQGVILSAITSVVTQTPTLSGQPVQSTIGTGTIAPALGVGDNHLYFWVVTGTVTESFVVQATVTDSNNEILVATMLFNVVSNVGVN